MTKKNDTKSIASECDDMLADRHEQDEKEISVWAGRTKLGRGRPKAVESPEVLWELAREYFQETDEKPFFKQEVLKGGPAAGTIVKVPTIRPYTWKAFENFLFYKGIASDLENYRYNKGSAYDEYIGIVTRIGSIIYNQKFEGAAVGAFNPNLIARELGLAEKTQQQVTLEQPLFGDDND
jgi:hypothetical protein